MKASIVAIVKENNEVSSFYIQTNQIINYKPGDFIYLILPRMHYSDLKGNIRHFSLSSSPTDGDILRITVKQGISGYKKTLFNLNAGDAVEIDGPQGVYPWPPEEQNNPHIFIAGGIGITPFISRLKFNLDEHINFPITLFYSNSNVQNVLFSIDLDKFKNNLPNFKLVHYLSEKNGRAGIEELNKIIQKESIYWITGPVGFVSDMENYLIKLGVNEDQIRTEKFTGYV